MDDLLSNKCKWKIKQQKNRTKGNELWWCRTTSARRQNDTIAYEKKKTKMRRVNKNVAKWKLVSRPQQRVQKNWKRPKSRLLRQNPRSALPSKWKGREKKIGEQTRLMYDEKMNASAFYCSFVQNSADNVHFGGSAKVAYGMNRQWKRIRRSHTSNWHYCTYTISLQRAMTEGNGITRNSSVFYFIFVAGSEYAVGHFTQFRRIKCSGLLSCRLFRPSPGNNWQIAFCTALCMFYTNFNPDSVHWHHQSTMQMKKSICFYLSWRKTLQEIDSSCARV